MIDSLIDLEKHLTDDEKLICESVSVFAKDKLQPIINQASEDGYFPKDVVKDFAALGLFVMNLPTPYGLNLSKIAYGLVCQELEMVDSSFRSFLSVQNSLVMYPIFEFGSDVQKEQYLPKLASGEYIGCFALTEADHGSDPSSMQTTAKKNNGGWIINGSKMWITNAPIADLIICWAMTDEGMRGFILDADLSGITINKMNHKMSLRASDTGEIIFKDVQVSDNALLPGTSTGLVSALKCLTQARYGICFGAIGAAISCLETALDYAKQRTQFGKPIAKIGRAHV